jgi:branched-chain amino acid transport system ATP-binding protein
MANILEVQGIHTYIGQFHILEDVSFDVPRGSVTVLLGRNGAGKTTTLRSIMGLWKPARGKINFNGDSLVGKPAYEIAQLGIGYVPEHRAIFRQLSVAENLKIAEREQGQFDQRIGLIFGLFPDLERLYNWPAGQLSGGQQQMLAIARALVPENSLLLIDEPSEGLAPILIQQMMQAIRQLADITTILLVEQNFRVASQLARQYAIIENGQSVHYGLMEDLIDNEELIQHYLGAA